MLEQRIIGVAGIGIYVFEFVCLIDTEQPLSSLNRDVTARYTLRCTSSGSVGQDIADMDSEASTDVRIHIKTSKIRCEQYSSGTWGKSAITLISE